jgi:metallo-beta-lactamase family protein
VDCREGDLGRRIVFSGDIGNHQAPILREPDGFDTADALLIETTYGNRIHDTAGTRGKMLQDIVIQAMRTGGKVVIPAFTVGRTQELLYILGELMVDGRIPRIPIILDSPMAIMATDIHRKHPECFDTETLERIRAGENPFDPPTLRLTRTVAQSRAINRISGPQIIMAGGGMCEGGRIVHHLKHSLYDPDTQVVFVGYQAAGTLGRVILNGAKKLRLFGEEIAVKARIKEITAFSAHADRDGLIDWLGKFAKPPQMTFIVHGEEQAQKDFAETVRERLGFSTYIPRLGQTVDLARLDEAAVGKRIFVGKPTPKAHDIGEIVARVAVAGSEFKDEIESYIGMLGKRIKTAARDETEQKLSDDDAARILEHMSEAVGGDVDRLNALIQSASGDS